MIAKSDVMPMLLAACPSFEPQWRAHTSDPIYDPSLLYIDLGEFARHLVGLIRSESTTEFAAVFAAIEDLHLEGDAYVREAATIGLLEGIQNIAGNNDVDPDLFEKWLHPETARWWRKLIKRFLGRQAHRAW